jgi:chaperonin GroES
MAIKPLGDRVLIEVIVDEEQKKGSLYIPDTAKEKPQKGKVVAVGKGKFENGTLIEPEVKSGDTVLYGKFAGTEVKEGETSYLVVRESDILAVID